MVQMLDYPSVSEGLLQQFLAWLSVRPRQYGETMDAWRTSCPRLSVWEDALAEGLISVDGRAARQDLCPVSLTQAGRERLAAG